MLGLSVFFLCLSQNLSARSDSILDDYSYGGNQ